LVNKKERRPTSRRGGMNSEKNRREIKRRKEKTWPEGFRVGEKKTIFGVRKRAPKDVEK